MITNELSPELVAFLNDHQFTHKGRLDHHYVAEKIQIFNEFFSDKEAIELAIHYARYYSPNRIQVQIFNEDTTKRWDLIIQRVNGEFGHQKFFNGTPEEQEYEVIETDANTSLFSYPLCDRAPLPGQALDNFLAVETDLINSL